MPDLQNCEFFLLRYVPDAVKDEFVNIGVVLLDPERKPELRFTRDWSRVQCMDPDADLEMLESLEKDLRASLLGNAAGNVRELMLKRLDDSFSNTIQISAVKACLTESPAAELETLSRMYLETPRDRKTSRARSLGARRRIVTRMRQAFEHEGVWAVLEKDIRVSQFTASGDPLKIDCGYQPNGVIRLFHALSLETEPDSAKVLAFSYPDLREGIAQAKKAKTELTAIVDEKLDRDSEQTAFALSTLKKNDIQIATTADLGRIAETARRELRM